MTDTIAYKIIDAAEWREALAEGAYAGSAVDLADGYIHLSAADQLEETARKHYAGRENLMLLTVNLTALGDTIVWEASRGGALFPHIYGHLPVMAVSEASPYSSPVGGRGAPPGPSSARPEDRLRDGGGQSRTPNMDQTPSVTAQSSAAPPPPTGEE